jgi:hypothetical protein
VNGELPHRNISDQSAKNKNTKFFKGDLKLENEKTTMPMVNTDNSLRRKNSKPSKKSEDSWGSVEEAYKPSIRKTTPKRSQSELNRKFKKLEINKEVKKQPISTAKDQEDSLGDILSHRSQDPHPKSDLKVASKTVELENSSQKSIAPDEQSKLSSERYSPQELRSKKSLFYESDAKDQQSRGNLAKPVPLNTDRKTGFDLSRVNIPYSISDKPHRGFVMGRKDSLANEGKLLDSSQDTKDMIREKKDESYGQRMDKITGKNYPDSFRIASSRRVSFKSIRSRESALDTPLVSGQNTINIPSIIKPMTPKASELNVRSEPVKALPLLKTSAKAINSRDQSPESNSGVQNPVFPRISLTTSLKYKQMNCKDPRKYLETANLSKPQLKLVNVSTPQKENLSVSDAELSRKNSLMLREHVDTISYSQAKTRHEVSAANQNHRSTSGLERFYDKPAIHIESRPTSRKSSIRPLASLLEFQPGKATTPNKMVSKQVGLGYFSLNNSKIHTNELDRSANFESKAPRVITVTNPTWTASPSTPTDTSITLLKSIRGLLANPSQPGFLNLQELETQNKQADYLRVQGSTLHSKSTAGSKILSLGALDQRKSVSSYTKSTINYLKTRYKKDIETNDATSDAMDKELDRLNSLISKASNPE